MRRALLAVVLAAVGCKSPGEALVEAATGGKVDFEKGKVTVRDEKGAVTITTEGGEDGTVTFKNDKGETAVLSGKDGTMRLASKDGVAEIGTGKLPDGFPLALIDGAKIVQSSRSQAGEKLTFHLMAEVPKAPKEVADYYAKALKDKGFADVQRADHTMGAMAMVTLNGKLKDLAVAVTALQQDESGKSTLTIAWEGK